MAEGGKILAATRGACCAATVRPGMSTTDLDAIAEDVHPQPRGATPAFKGLYGFPGSICTSINEEIVHGIPSQKRVLKDGDIVSLDVGVELRGLLHRFGDDGAGGRGRRRDAAAARRDAARRWRRAIAAARAGNHIGDIGAAMQAVVEAAGFSVVRDLVGHGIGVEFHEEPQVPNYGKPKRGHEARARA